MDTDCHARAETIIRIFLGKEHDIFTIAKFLVSVYFFCTYVYLFGGLTS